VSDLAHPLAETPDLEPAAPLPQATVVDAALTAWLRRNLSITCR
jgi:hypothetical protein